MLRPIPACAILVAFLLACAAPDARPQAKTDAEGYEEVPMKFVPFTSGRPKEGYEFLPFTCPESLSSVHVATSGQDQRIPLPYGDQNGLKCATLETSLEIDLNNDGKVDTKAKGKDTQIPCKLIAKDGTSYDYMFRITRVETSGSTVDWLMQRSCYMEGSYDKTKIRVIDDDSNGIYGEFGRDAIAIGNSADHAAPLGPLCNINNKIYRLKLNATGTKLLLKPFEGETGKLDAVKSYATTAKLVWAVFKGKDSWFDCAVQGKDTEVVVPVDTYQLAMGRVYARPQGARIRSGSMKSVEVKKGEVAVVEWGAPVRINFSYAFEGRILKIEPGQIEAVGNGGETYWRFEPEDMTPQVMIRNKDTKKVVHKGNIILRADPRAYDPNWWMWRSEYSEQVKNEEGPFEVYMIEDQFGRLWPGQLVGDWH